MVDTSDLLPKTPRYLKVPLIILNAILWVLGLILIIIGGIALSKIKNMKEVISVSLPAGLIVIGVFFILLTIVGCVVAYKEKLVGLVFYTVFMLVLLICLIGVGGGSITYRNDIETPIYKGWEKSNPNSRVFIENYLECCGWNATNANTTNTKCLKDNGTGTPTRDDSKPFCEALIVDFVNDNLYLAGSAAVAIGVIEFISMLFALFLIIRICNSPRSKSYD
ncbi:hypothetical protein CYY_003489 [Polysphondylium violaceum]|uniref:Tetraspanin n=1 Tax=Polysphondylium violaceum TaxID=133409 RepID=A0A8J4PYB6_9MYCE|nr:hypothetical protein CYY_003489 [Polysphondylium violaceum]